MEWMLTVVTISKMTWHIHKDVVHDTADEADERVKRTCLRVLPQNESDDYLLVWYVPGVAYVHFTKTGDYYSWRKVETYVNNIVVGKLWIDHYGRTTITNHKNKDYCELILQAKTRQVRLSTNNNNNNNNNNNKYKVGLLMLQDFQPPNSHQLWRYVTAVGL